MKIYLILAMLLVDSFIYAQAPVVCNDTIFYRVNTNRTFPKFSCDTVYVITQGHYQQLFVLKHQDRAIRESLNREIELYRQQEQNLIALSARHKSYVDSLETFIVEKNLQLDSMTVLAKQATNNTSKALKVAKTNRAVSIGSSVISLLLLILMALK